MRRRHEIPIKGMGVDIVEVKRIRRAVRRWGDRFLKKIFTANELTYALARKSLYEHLAARFAAKEAVYKAFGGNQGLPLDWCHIEILNQADGRPVVRLHGHALELQKKEKIAHIMVSMSHAKEWAVGVALLSG
jgi:holo-[acyl-carrier protein] synthase